MWHPGTMLTNLEANVDALDDDDDDGNVVFGVAPKGTFIIYVVVVYSHISRRGP